MKNPNKHIKPSLKYVSFIKGLLLNFILVGIHSMQDWWATTRHEATRKSRKILKEKKKAA